MDRHHACVRVSHHRELQLACFGTCQARFRVEVARLLQPRHAVSWNGPLYVLCMPHEEAGLLCAAVALERRVAQCVFKVVENGAASCLATGTQPHKIVGLADVHSHCLGESVNFSQACSNVRPLWAQVEDTAGAVRRPRVEARRTR